ncbi:MAG: dTMP kinase [Candidatus Yonathbacteria bacterium]|nr:dTMP kinase [Candidatus Yonathbacteria bacterium]
MKKVPLIIFDGLDGSGKSTQVTLLKERINRKHKVLFTREPGGAPLSEKIRDIFSTPEGAQSSAQTQLFLVSASRSNWIEEVTVPNLKEGTPVISERGDSSTFAYQIYMKKRLDLERLFWEIRDVLFGEWKPSHYFIFDVSAVEAKRRVNTDTKRTRSIFDMDPIDSYERARDGFHLFVKKLPGEVTLIDGDRDPKIIHEEVYAKIKELCEWK